MYGILKENLKTIFAMVLVIMITHAMFFMAFSYCMSGDPLLALRNFYSIMYNIG